MAKARRSLYAVSASPGSFAAMLVETRNSDDLTQSDLAARIGVRPQTIGAWERGERPQSRFFAALVDYLRLANETELRDLLDRSTSDHPRSDSTPPAAYRSSEDALMAMTQVITARAREGDLNAGEINLFQHVFDYHAHRLSSEGDRR